MLYLCTSTCFSRQETNQNYRTLMKRYEELSEDLLFEKMNQCDETAFNEVYQRYRPLLLAHADRLLQDTEASGDLVQDVFVKIFSTRGRLDTKIPLRNYLYAAVRNAVINLFAHRNVGERYITHLTNFMNNYDDENSADVRLLEKELEEFIEKEILNLPPQMRLFFEASRKEGLSHKEIAERYNRKESTVSKQISNALQRIRAKLYCLFLICLVVIIFFNKLFN